MSFRVLAKALECTHSLLVVGRVALIADILVACDKLKVNFVELRCDQLEFALLLAQTNRLKARLESAQADSLQ